jgi:hypothetical protein
MSKFNNKIYARRDIAEILQKSALNTNHSINKFRVKTNKNNTSTTGCISNLILLLFWYSVMVVGVTNNTQDV